MITPDVHALMATQSSNTNSDDDEDQKNQVPQDFSMMSCGSQLFDLKDPTQAQAALESTEANRAKLNDGQLATYEGKSTEFGQGGRSNLLYDHVRADLAVEKHQGTENGTWRDHHNEALKVVQVVAAKHAQSFNGGSK
jgi:hypothetical protein